MEDMDRYGEYDEIDDEYGKSKRPAILILKILTAVVCISVLGVLAFRIILFNSYPDNIKNIYYTEKLLNYYRDTDGDIGAITQKLRVPYDDPKKGKFFCDNLIIIKGIDEIQLSLRFNTSTIEQIKKDNNFDSLDFSDGTFLKFRLTDNYGNVYENIAYQGYEKKMMYRYYKLVFSDIELDTEEDRPNIEWMRIEIFVDGQTSDKPYAMIPVYENNKEYDIFENYELSKEEIPE